MHGCARGFGQGVGGINQRVQRCVIAAQHFIGAVMAAQVNDIRIGQQHLLAVCENHFCVNPAVLCADKLHACRGQRIERRDTLCAFQQDKGVVGGVIGRCRSVQQVIGCHVGVGACLQQGFKLRIVRVGFQLGGMASDGVHGAAKRRVAVCRAAECCETALNFKGYSLSGFCFPAE